MEVIQIMVKEYNGIHGLGIIIHLNSRKWWFEENEGTIYLLKSKMMIRRQWGNNLFT
jgi:hypothetical protein